MIKVRFLSTAQADLISIRQYSLGEFGASVADGYFLGFQKVWALLREYPLAGAAKPELGPDIRCYVHRSHRFFYSIEDDVVLIRRVVHHAMNVRRALQ